MIDEDHSSAPSHLTVNRVTVSPECTQAFNELKLGKSTKWIIYKLSDNQKEIVVEESGKDTDWSAFREKLLAAKSPDGKKGARYAIYDVGYEAEGGAGVRSKITFIAWSPDDAGIKVGRVVLHWTMLILALDEDGVLLIKRCPQARAERCGCRDPG